jgi:hypothetical protein
MEKNASCLHTRDFVDTTAGDSGKRGTLQFGIPKKLRPILARSERWGRIKTKVVCSMTSKYSIALYELVQARAEMQRCVETFPLRNRGRSWVYLVAHTSSGLDFKRFVIEPALLEVNGLSDMGVQVELRRKHTRAPVHEVAVAWWKKHGDEYRAAPQERGKSKLGRKARLRGTVESPVRRG